MSDEHQTKWPVSFYRDIKGNIEKEGTVACYQTEVDGADHEFQFLHFGKREQDYQCRECKNLARRSKQACRNTSLKIVRTASNPTGYFQRDPNTLSHMCTADEPGGFEDIIDTEM